MTLRVNWDVHVGDTVYRVQTENGGIAGPVIEALVYAQGHVMHRRMSSYEDFFGSGDLSEDALQRADLLTLHAAAAGTQPWR